MIKTCLSLGLAAALLASLPAPRAQAQQVARTYVKPDGTNSGSCAIGAPCSSLQLAHDGTSPGGAVECLSGGPGQLIEATVTITKSITIECSNSIIWGINISGFGITVTLRNLVLNGFQNGNTGGVGINFANGNALIVDHCTIENFDTNTTLNVGGPGIGIKIAPPDGTPMSVHILDSVISGNGLSQSGGGIVVQPTGTGSARVLIERSKVVNNTYGIFANGTGSTGLVSVQVHDTVVSNSKFSGISSFASAGHSIVSIVVDHSSSLLNGANGILSQGGNAFVFLSESTVMSNVTGLNPVSGGAIFSYQNNRLTGNVTDGAPTAVLTVK